MNVCLSLINQITVHMVASMMSGITFAYWNPVLDILLAEKLLEYYGNAI